jgi:hypothetical protein
VRVCSSHGSSSGSCTCRDTGQLPAAKSIVLLARGFGSCSDAGGSVCSVQLQLQWHSLLQLCSALKRRIRARFSGMQQESAIPVVRLQHSVRKQAALANTHSRCNSGNWLLPFRIASRALTH